MAITAQDTTVIHPGAAYLIARARRGESTGNRSDPIDLRKVLEGTTSPAKHRATTLENSIIDFENRESAMQDEILRSYSGAHGSALNTIRRDRAEERGGIDQSLGARGLYNSSLADSLKSRSREGESLDIGNLAGQRASVLQTFRPNPNIYGPLIQQMAAQPQKRNILGSILPAIGGILGSIVGGPAGTIIGGASGIAGGLSGSSGGGGGSSGIQNWNAPDYSSMFRGNGRMPGFF